MIEIRLIGDDPDQLADAAAAVAAVFDLTGPARRYPARPRRRHPGRADRSAGRVYLTAAAVRLTARPVEEPTS